MKLEEGRLYNVTGIWIQGAGDTAKRVIQTHEEIMYVQDESLYQGGVWGVHVFLADGDQHGGLIDREILTRVKIPLKRYTLLGEEVITSQELGRTLICMPFDDHFESITRFLEKAERYAERLQSGEKKDRFERKIKKSLYGKSVKREGDLVITTVRDPAIRDLMREIFPQHVD